jgi:hypothetical protein
MTRTRAGLAALLLSLASTSVWAAAPASPAAPANTRPAAGGHYKSFTVCLYCPVGTLTLQRVEAQWAAITSQVKVDKVYIETYRSRRALDEAAIEPLKKFFTDRGVKVAGGMTLASNDSGQFTTFSMANADDRQVIKTTCEKTAKYFDEIILDDFFFYSTKTDADIAAKGNKSWTQYRLEAMREASENLVVKPIKAVNPNAKVIIKYPNWYEHFQGLGYDLEIQPKIFDGIYTGTETRDPVTTEQHLQPYESYQIVRYFENITPGRNGGGWVDGYQYRIIDRYAEQLWDTVFAKPREMMLFNWGQIQEQARPGDRAAWQDLHTSLDLSALQQNGQAAPLQLARVAGYALEQADQFLYKTGKPMGVKSYRPYQATGEDFLHNFLGMVGIPMDVHPTYPADAQVILLTEAAKHDPDIVAKIKQSLAAGKNVVVTSGLVKALLAQPAAPGNSLSDICELEITGNKVLVSDFHGQGGAPIANAHLDKPIVFPEVKFKTNDAWFVLAGVANGNGFPVLISDKYSRGVLYVLAIPDNFTDLYSIPPTALNLVRNILTRDLPVRIEGPAQVALFEYDNDTFIVQNFAAAEATVTVGVTRPNSRLRNLVTDETLSTQSPPGRGRGRGFGGQNNPDFVPPRTSFTVTIKPHSYLAFAVEGQNP